MGCDIHVYLEKVDENYYSSGRTYIHYVADFHPGRNYTMFALMAGVRNYDDITLFQPKGLPEEVSYWTRHENTLYVMDDDKFIDQERCVRRSVAEKWIADGKSRWEESMNSHSWVTHPDWHSHSWLTFEEMQQVKAAYTATSLPVEGWYQKSSELDWTDPKLKDVTRDRVKIVYQDKGTMKGYYEVAIGPESPAQFPVAYEAMIAALGALGEGGRIVFWFDN